jgi:hypothetical protein
MDPCPRGRGYVPPQLEPTDPSRQDRYRTEQFGCGILLAIVVAVLLFFVLVPIVWYAIPVGGPKP